MMSAALVVTMCSWSIVDLILSNEMASCVASLDRSPQLPCPWLRMAQQLMEHTHFVIT